MSVIVEVITEDFYGEWTLEFTHTGPTRRVPATLWQPEEGGEVEVEFTTATHGEETLTYEEFCARFRVDQAEERRMNDAAEEAVRSEDEPGYPRDGFVRLER